MFGNRFEWTTWTCRKAEVLPYFLTSVISDFKPTQCVKNLAMIFDSELNFIPHIKNITRKGFYHLKNIARVRPFLSQASTEVLMHAFISCRLDYCNALLAGLPKKSISNLQLLQNLAADVYRWSNWWTRRRRRETIRCRWCSSGPQHSFYPHYFYLHLMQGSETERRKTKIYLKYIWSVEV